MLQPKSGTADITPGEGRVLAADGTVSPVKVADSLTADGQRVVRVENVSQSLKMDILVAKTTGDMASPAYVTPSATGGVVITMKAGGTVRVRILGFKPRSNVDVFMASTPTKVATVAVQEDGSVTTDIVVPSSLTNGTHTLQIQGTDGVTNSVQAIAYGVTITGGAAAGTSTTVAGGTNLPSSGPSTTMLAIVAASLLGGLGIWSRRRTA